MFFDWASGVLDACLVALGLARSPRRSLGALRAAWSSVPGDLLGRLAMRGCRIPAPTRVVQVDGVEVALVEDSRTGRLLDNQLMPIHAQTLGRYVFCRGPISDYILAHELEHVRQWRRFGPLFEPLYFASSGVALMRRRPGYLANWFEAAARRRADEFAATTGTTPRY